MSHDDNYFLKPQEYHYAPNQIRLSYHKCNLTKILTAVISTYFYQIQSTSSHSATQNRNQAASDADCGHSALAKHGISQNKLTRSSDIINISSTADRL